MTRNKREQETVIVFNAAEPEASIWSADPAFQQRMARIGIIPTYQARGAKGNEEESSASYQVPKQWVHVARPRRITVNQRSLQNLKKHHRNDSTESGNCEGINKAA